MSLPEAIEAPDPRALLGKVVIGAIALIGLVAVLSVVLRDPITALGAWFVGNYGAWGVFAGVFLIDVMPISLHDPVMMAGHTGGLGFVELASAGGSASLLASVVDYYVGAYAGHRIGFVRRLIERYGVTAFMQRYGPSAMMLTAIMPFPFTIVAWAAGMSRVPLHFLAAAAVLRVCKMLAVLGLIAFGWSLGG